MKKQNYAAKGMGLGMCFGGLTYAFLINFSKDNVLFALPVCIIGGMFLGLLISMCIPRK